MRNNKNESFQKMMKVAKRITIAILICIPICVIFGYFTRNVITSNFWQIVCFMVIMGTGVLIEGLIAKRKEQKKEAEEILNTKKDVFK